MADRDNVQVKEVEVVYNEVGTPMVPVGQVVKTMGEIFCRLVSCEDSVDARTLSAQEYVCRMRNIISDFETGKEFGKDVKETVDLWNARVDNYNEDIKAASDALMIASLHCSNLAGSISNLLNMIYNNGYPVATIPNSDIPNDLESIDDDLNGMVKHLEQLNKECRRIAYTMPSFLKTLAICIGNDEVHSTVYGARVLEELEDDLDRLRDAWTYDYNFHILKDFTKEDVFVHMPEKINRLRDVIQHIDLVRIRTTQVHYLPESYTSLDIFRKLINEISALPNGSSDIIETYRKIEDVLISITEKLDTLDKVQDISKNYRSILPKTTRCGR